MNYPPHLQAVIANGGLQVHVKQRGNNRALCGHEPANTASMMRQRGRWLLARDQEREPTCKKCKAKLGNLFCPHGTDTVRGNGCDACAAEYERANTTLIAAAPDLLAACKRAADYLRDAGDDTGMPALLNAAIAKATGENNG